MRHLTLALILLGLFLSATCDDPQYSYYRFSVKKLDVMCFFDNAKVYLQNGYFLPCTGSSCGANGMGSPGQYVTIGYSTVLAGKGGLCYPLSLYYVYPSPTQQSLTYMRPPSVFTNIGFTISFLQSTPDSSVNATQSANLRAINTVPRTVTLDGVAANDTIPPAVAQVNPNTSAVTLIQAPPSMSQNTVVYNDINLNFTAITSDDDLTFCGSALTKFYTYNVPPSSKQRYNYFASGFISSVADPYYWVGYYVTHKMNLDQSVNALYFKTNFTNVPTLDLGSGVKTTRRLLGLSMRDNSALGSVKFFCRVLNFRYVCTLI